MAILEKLEMSHAQNNKKEVTHLGKMSIIRSQY